MLTPFSGAASIGNSFPSAFEKLLLIQPSFATAERVFLLLNASFYAPQEHTLEDSVKVAIRQQYNRHGQFACCSAYYLVFPGMNILTLSPCSLSLCLSCGHTDGSDGFVLLVVCRSAVSECQLVVSVIVR